MPKNNIRKLSYDKISYSKTLTVWTSLTCSSLTSFTPNWDCKSCCSEAALECSL